MPWCNMPTLNSGQQTCRISSCVQLGMKQPKPKLRFAKFTKASAASTASIPASCRLTAEPSHVWCAPSSNTHVLKSARLLQPGAATRRSKTTCRASASVPSRPREASKYCRRHASLCAAMGLVLIIIFSNSKPPLLPMSLASWQVSWTFSSRAFASSPRHCAALYTTLCSPPPGNQTSATAGKAPGPALSRAPRAQREMAPKRPATSSPMPAASRAVATHGRNSLPTSPSVGW
mmetsp:Transcript_98612/g.317954  ORF Transcript_98612/g.317954 Transcript_98612/m.317954 type:complete len:233 (-) Transcript_98612:203-901(-)